VLIFFESLKLHEQDNDKDGLEHTLHNLAKTYVKEKNYSKAQYYADRALVIANELGYPSSIGQISLLISDINKANGNFKNALDYYERYLAMSDSISNEETRKATVKSQLKYEYEKEILTDSIAHANEKVIRNAEILSQATEIRTKKQQAYVLYGGLVVVIIFGVFILGRYKLSQEQKRVIETQKREVEEKQREILDSIFYARRIQRALITNENYLAKNLKRLNKN
jgi:tetratricopeptide (TPR) repeat protein